MKRWHMKPQHYVIAAVVSFLIAVINLSGLVLRDDLMGRLIIGAIWSAVGIGWSSRYYYVRLKAREREVRDLRESLLARGRTNREIAEELVVGTETVKTHIGNILAKLHLAHRTQVVIHALKQGLISLDEIEL
jgi:DNA-binding CsgD family transcriptional regulator